MKILITILSIFLFSIHTYADTPLTAQMKDIGQQFKVLASGIQHKSFTEVQLQAVIEMQKSVTDASLIYPETADTAELKAKYSMWMAELAKMVDTLKVQTEELLKQDPQDFTAVTQTLIEMNDLRKEAHNVLKPD